MGPLAGFRIIEMAGIGPAPFAAMLLADMGAEVIRVDRREAADLGLPGREPKFDVLHRGRRSLAVDRQGRGRARRRQAAGRQGRRADRGLPSRRDGAAGARRPRSCSKLNPKLVFGRMTGFGQDGPLAQRRRPRHQLHRARRRAALHRPQGRGAGAAAEPGRRLRRRRHVPGLRRGVRAAGGAEVGQGPGGGCRHGRRRGLSDGADLRPATRRAPGRTSAASTCSTAARPGTTSTRPRTASGCRSAPSRSASTRSWSRSWA